MESSSDFGSNFSERNLKSEPESRSNEGNEYAVQSFNGETQENVVDDLERQSLTAESVSRTVSRRLSNVNELYEEAAHSKEPMPKMGGNKPYPPTLPDREPYLVAYDGPDDPIFPHNWTLKSKLLSCFCVGLSALSVSMGSAMFSLGAIEIMAEFHIGSVVATLGTSLFVFGFASGPIIWGPLSELYGRKVVLVPSLFGYMCFSFATATAKDIIYVRYFFCESSR